VFHLRGGWSHALLGYSYKTSQYGLVIDNVVGYELVLPNGTARYVNSKDKDVYFQGGMNNFVRYHFVAKAKFMTCWPLIGDCDQIRHDTGRLVSFPTPRINWMRSEKHFSNSNRRMTPRLRLL